MEARYHYPSFIEFSYECPMIRDMLYLEFSTLLEEGEQFQKCRCCGLCFLSRGAYHG